MGNIAIRQVFSLGKSVEFHSTKYLDFGLGCLLMLVHAADQRRDQGSGDIGGPPGEGQDMARNSAAQLLRHLRCGLSGMCGVNGMTRSKVARDQRGMQSVWFRSEGGQTQGNGRKG